MGSILWSLLHLRVKDWDKKKQNTKEDGHAHRLNAQPKPSTPILAPQKRRARAHTHTQSCFFLTAPAAAAAAAPSPVLLLLLHLLFGKAHAAAVDRLHELGHAELKAAFFLLAEILAPEGRHALVEAHLGHLVVQPQGVLHLQLADLRRQCFLLRRGGTRQRVHAAFPLMGPPQANATPDWIRRPQRGSPYLAADADAPLLESVDSSYKCKRRKAYIMLLETCSGRWAETGRADEGAVPPARRAPRDERPAESVCGSGAGRATGWLRDPPQRNPRWQR